MTATTKEKLIRVLQTLPEETTTEEAMERILFMAKVEKGLQQADKGDDIPHSEVKKRVEEWVE